VGDRFASAPRELQTSTSRPELRYEREPDLVAIHGGEPGTIPQAQRLDAQTLVAPATVAAAAARTGARLGPVYRRLEGGTLVVPTGAALVRFAEGDPVESHRGELRKAGYELAETLTYAPHAGWVRAVEDDVVAALRGLDQLRDLPGVEHVEPQVLSERRPRSS
jgi:hypothetical protein